MSAELHFGAALCDAERLVNHRMVMHERINAVAPLAVPPAIGLEEVLDCGSGGDAFVQIDGVFVQQHRQCRIVRHFPSSLNMTLIGSFGIEDEKPSCVRIVPGATGPSVVMAGLVPAISLRCAVPS